MYYTCRRLIRLPPAARCALRGFRWADAASFKCVGPANPTGPDPAGIMDRVYARFTDCRAPAFAGSLWGRYSSLALRATGLSNSLVSRQTGVAQDGEPAL
jgi:hypothetical protein